MFEKLFEDMRALKGPAYAKARDEFLARGNEVIAFLEQKTASGKNEEERWLAQIILARAKQPEEFRQIERSFHEKVLVAKYGIPWLGEHARIVPPRGGGYRFPTNNLLWIRTNWSKAMTN